MWSSRRGFLAASAAVIGLPTGLRAEAFGRSFRSTRPYRDMALRTARWIEASRQETEHGVRYPADPLKPESVGFDFYNGMPGVVAFFAALYHATHDQTWFAAAEAGGRHLLHAVATEGDKLDGGLYTGLAGISYSFSCLDRGKPNTRWGAEARRLIDPVASRALTTDSWDIISGLAGTGLFLLSAGAPELAAKVGRRLIGAGEPAEGGLMWYPSGSLRRNYPNFSHGTAGAAYFLASLYRSTKERAFLDAALRGATYLEAVATKQNGATRIFHQSGGGEDRYYLSWCHGPVGTARLFYRLHQITGEARWSSWVDSLTRGVFESGVPEQRTSGYWNNVSQCCGNVGIGQYCIDLARYRKSTASAPYRRRIVDDTIRRATDDTAGLRWPQAENRTQPDHVVAQTGFMQGAAGIGMFLLQLDAFEQGQQWTFPMPDTPFSD